jgi:1-aminocyclopropane-1-carboxylate deaminase/D-cysteine desulfhydrase
VTTGPDLLEARARLAALPRAPLGSWPTPLQRLERFGAALGLDVWAKRDDVGAVGLAGNKVRKFELVLGAAVAEDADTLVTTGAAQSNSARTGAAAAAALGMRCVLVLSGAEPSPPPTANLLLDRLFGAETRFAGAAGWDELNGTVEAVAAEVRAAGGRPVSAPVGCSSALGALGFALAYLELTGQLAAVGLRPDLVVHASTSGGTHAGLVAGRRLAGGGPPIRAYDAGRIFADPAGACAMLASGALALVGCDEVVPAAEIDVDASHVGKAYGRPTAAATEAIDLLARTEGILCDPVYSGKALAGLVADARSGRVPAGSTVVFWHTGGWHVLFDPAYAANQLGLA